MKNVYRKAWSARWEWPQEIWCFNQTTQKYFALWKTVSGQSSSIVIKTFLPYLENPTYVSLESCTLSTSKHYSEKHFHFNEVRMHCIWSAWKPRVYINKLKMREIIFNFNEKFPLFPHNYGLNLWWKSWKWTGKSLAFIMNSSATHERRFRNENIFKLFAYWQMLLNHNLRLEKAVGIALIV